MKFVRLNRYKLWYKFYYRKTRLCKGYFNFIEEDFVKEIDK